MTVIMYTRFCISIKISTQFIIQFGNLNLRKHFLMKLWSRLSKALLKSEKNIKPFSLRLLIQSIVSCRIRTFSPIYLPFINSVWSGLIMVGNLVFILFAIALDAILQSTFNNEIGLQLFINNVYLFFFGSNVIILCSNTFYAYMQFTSALRLTCTCLQNKFWRNASTCTYICPRRVFTSAREMPPRCCHGYLAAECHMSNRNLDGANINRHAHVLWDFDAKCCNCKAGARQVKVARTDDEHFVVRVSQQEV